MATLHQVIDASRSKPAELFGSFGDGACAIERAPLQLESAIQEGSDEHLVSLNDAARHSEYSANHFAAIQEKL